MPDTSIPATVTACTLDPESRTATFHLSATSPSGEALSLLFPIRFPTVAELEAERGGVEILSDTEGQEQSADACPGCGCLPGDGLTPGCDHPDGCGYMPQGFGEEKREAALTTSAERAGQVAFTGGHYPDVEAALLEYLLPATSPEELERLDAVAFRRGWMLAQTTAEGKSVENRPMEPRSLAASLRLLAEYLDPQPIPKELRDHLFLPDPETPDYGPAGQERVVARLFGDLESYADSLPTEGEPVCTLALALREIMGGATPSGALADYGFLDG